MRTPERGLPSAASTTRPASVEVGARAIATGSAAAPWASTAEARPRSPPSATSEPASRGAPSRRKAPSARASTQRVVCVRPSNRTRAPGAGVRLSASVTVPRRTCPSASVTGRASAPARTGCLSCVAKAGASTRIRFPSSAAASNRNVPSAFVTVDCGRPEAGVASCDRRPPPVHRVTVAPTTGPPRSSATRPARARAFGSRTSPASSPPESKSRSSTRGDAGAPENDSRTAAPAGPGTVTANVPSGRVVPETSGFGRSSRRASRRAAAKPSSNGSTATATPAAGFPSTSTRPRISLAGATAASAVGTPAGNRRLRDRAAATEDRRRRDMGVLPKRKGTPLMGRSRGAKSRVVIPRDSDVPGPEGSAGIADPSSLGQIGLLGVTRLVVARQRHGRWSRLWILRAPTRPPPSG